MMDITELAKKACNRTRNANQWLAEGVPEKAKIELNDLGQMLADNIGILQNGSKTVPEKNAAAADGDTERKVDVPIRHAEKGTPLADGDTVNAQDEERSVEGVGANQWQPEKQEEKETPTEPDHQASQ